MPKQFFSCAYNLFFKGHMEPPCLQNILIPVYFHKTWRVHVFHFNSNTWIENHLKNVSALVKYSFFIVLRKIILQVTSGERLTAMLIP